MSPAPKVIYDNLRPGIEKSMCKKEDILNILKDKNIEVLITLGAGDIDNYVPEIKELLETKKLRMFSISSFLHILFSIPGRRLS